MNQMLAKALLSSYDFECVIANHGKEALKILDEDTMEMNTDLAKFNAYYNFHRRHGSLRKELNVKKPFQAVEKWHELKHELFKITPNEFKNNILNLQSELINLHQ